MSKPSNKIKLAGIINESVVDGPGFRTVFFTQGCLLKCPGCQNPHTWDKDGGTEYDIQELAKYWRENPLIEGITISGGEPTLQCKACLELAKLAIEDGMNVMLYTGYYYYELKQREENEIHELLDIVTYLVEGPFSIEERSLKLLYRGSMNQNIIDLSQTKLTGNVVFFNEEM